MEEKDKNRKRKPLILHPLLFVLFPVLFLYAQNAYLMRLKDVIGPLVEFVLGVVVLTVLFTLILRNKVKGALMATLVAFLFFTFGHIIEILPDFRILFGETEIGRSGLIFLIWCLIIYYSFKYIRKSNKAFLKLTRALNFIGLVLVAVQIVHGGFVLLTRVDASDTVEKNSPAEQSAYPEIRPDVYYLILDGYGRSDVLREIFGYDNSEFISFLRDRGFVVMDKGHSNYCQTLLSLSSTLNMNFVKKLGDFDRNLKDRLPLNEKLWDNEVFRFFKNRGYKTVSFASGSSATEFEKVDFYVSPSWTVNEFRNILMTTTPLPLFLYDEKSQYAQHRKRLNYILDKLPDIYEVTSPKIVFAHILSPHPPFVFGPDGEELQPDRTFYAGDGSHFMDRGGTVEEYKNGYKGQITYITKRIKKTIEAILDRAGEKQPIIVLQADHGSGSGLSWLGVNKTDIRERFSILNAVYLPGGDTSVFYDGITPVNTFRIILNQYFDTDYELLADRCFYTTWAHPFNFIEVTRQLGPDVYQPRYYAEAKPVDYRDINKPKKQGTKWDTTGCFVLDDDGIRVDLGRKRHDTGFSISVDNNDDYTLYFRDDTALVARMNISPKIIKEGGLRVDERSIPERAVKEGFDNILIIPYGGDQRYSVGHMSLR
ncbi:MAG: hypothetical protein JXA92_01300 [candidate division Zixibacteria bacterium]|nr:hypothetical protein [candidate division Zixibacteria bacterium]